MTDTNNNKKQRAAKRYIYPQSAVCEVDGQSLDVQMLNISTSGIQFASKIKIETKNPVSLAWNDEKFGDFNLTLLVAREIYKPESREFPYYYGLQYYSLVREMKDKLLVLLRTFKYEDKKQVTKQVEKLTPEYLLKIISDGKDFFKRALTDGKADHFDSLIAEIKDYEKEAFAKTDGISVCIQDVVMHNFHCNLLGMMTAFVVEKRDLLPAFLEHIQKKMMEITTSENKLEETAKKLLKEFEDEEEERLVQKHINETNNRLFYTKQGLLHSVVENFDYAELDSPESMQNFDKIRNEFERIQEFTSHTFQEGDTSKYNYRTKRPKDYSKADAILDLPVQGLGKPNYFLWFNIFLIIVCVTILGFIKLSNYKDKIALQEEIGLSIDIVDSKKDGTQIDLVVRAAEWKQLPLNHKNASLQKIVKFLLVSKTLRSCILYNDQHKIIKILYEDTPD